MLYITNDKDYFEKSKLSVIHLELKSKKLFLTLIDCMNNCKSILDISNCFYNKTEIQIDFKTIRLLKINADEDLFFERIKYQLINKLNLNPTDAIIYMKNLADLPTGVKVIEKRHKSLKWK